MIAEKSNMTVSQESTINIVLKTTWRKQSKHQAAVDTLIEKLANACKKLDDDVPELLEASSDSDEDW